MKVWLICAHYWMSILNLKYHQNLPQQTEKKKGGRGLPTPPWININLVVSQTKKFFMRFVYLSKFFIAFSNDPVFDQSFLLFLWQVLPFFGEGLSSFNYKVVIFFSKCHPKAVQQFGSIVAFRQDTTIAVFVETNNLFSKERKRMTMGKFSPI